MRKGPLRRTARRRRGCRCDQDWSVLRAHLGTALPATWSVPADLETASDSSTLMLGAGAQLTTVGMPAVCKRLLRVCGPSTWRAQRGLPPCGRRVGARSVNTEMSLPQEVTGQPVRGTCLTSARQDPRACSSRSLCFGGPAGEPYRR
jgi:hypothetical protein